MQIRFATATAGDLVQDHIHVEVPGIPKALHVQLFPGPLLLPPDVVVAGLAGRWRQRLRTRHQATGGPFDQPAPCAGGEGAGLVDFTWAAALAEAVLATMLESLPGPAQAICRAWLAATADLQPVLDAIDRRLDDPPGNPELARLCHLSENQFIRRFRAALGVTPARYGLDRRLEAASRLLSRGSVRIQQVAALTGFFDRPHFVRSFRRRYGLSPAAYRSMHGDRGG